MAGASRSIERRVGELERAIGFMLSLPDVRAALQSALVSGQTTTHSD